MVVREGWTVLDMCIGRAKEKAMRLGDKKATATHRVDGVVGNVVGMERSYGSHLHSSALHNIRDDWKLRHILIA